MSSLDYTAVAVLDDQQGLAELPDFTTDAYKDAYSRINAIVIKVSRKLTTITSP